MRNERKEVFLLITLILAAVIFPLTAYIRIAAVGIEEEKQTTHTATNHISSNAECDTILDQFEAVFDKRRKSRQEVMANKKNLRQFKDDKSFWDPYEPEANCFSDEHFGFFTDSKTNLMDQYKSIKRYASFGDCLKFVCGDEPQLSPPSPRINMVEISEIMEEKFPTFNAPLGPTIPLSECGHHQEAKSRPT